MACIVLIGFMASGKTTVGRALSAIIGGTFVDTDTEVERREGMPIPEIFERKGESLFRRLETRVLRELMGSDITGHLIIATGGGLPCTGDNISFMNSRGITVYLRSSIDEIMARVGRIRERPVFQRTPNREGLVELLRKREQFYTQAQVIVENRNDMPPRNTAEKIAEILMNRYGIQRDKKV